MCIKILPLFLFFPLGIFAQRIINFNLYQANSSVAVKFTLTAGSTCNGFKVLRSTDSLSFTEVYDYPTICGTSTGNEELSGADAAPVANQINYYKIRLSTQETSFLRSIYVLSQPESKLMLYPNPVYPGIETLYLRLLNGNNIHVTGHLIGPCGNILRALDLTTTGDQASIKVDELGTGLYLVRLTNGNQHYSSKFVVYR